jgi:hypothetical protein
MTSAFERQSRHLSSNWFLEALSAEDDANASVTRMTQSAALLTSSWLKILSGNGKLVSESPSMVFNQA